MTDWTYREARDRSLRALLEKPVTKPALGIDWSYAAAVAWRRFEIEHAIEIFALKVQDVLRGVHDAVMAVGEAIIEALRPMVEALTTLFESFRNPAPESDVPSLPPPWRSSRRVIAPRTLGGSAATMTRRPALSHRPRDCC